MCIQARSDQAGGHFHVKWCNWRCNPGAVDGHQSQCIQKASQSAIEKMNPRKKERKEKSETSMHKKKQRFKSETNHTANTTCLDPFAPSNIDFMSPNLSFT